MIEGHALFLAAREEALHAQYWLFSLQLLQKSTRSCPLIKKSAWHAYFYALHTYLLVSKINSNINATGRSMFDKYINYMILLNYNSFADAW